VHELRTAWSWETARPLFTLGFLLTYLVGDIATGHAFADEAMELVFVVVLGMASVKFLDARAWRRTRPARELASPEFAHVAAAYAVRELSVENSRVTGATLQTTKPFESKHVLVAVRDAELRGRRIVLCVFMRERGPIEFRTVALTAVSRRFQPLTITAFDARTWQRKVDPATQAPAVARVWGWIAASTHNIDFEVRDAWASCATHSLLTAENLPHLLEAVAQFADLVEA
jgi:hypothetical protein